MISNEESAASGVRSALGHGRSLIVFLAICLGAGGLGAMVTTPEIRGWYQTLQKPSWNPPNSVFGPVWTTLFLMMAVAGWLVWDQCESTERRSVFLLFGTQLFLNICWSCVFFGLHQPGWAFAEILVLWAAITATVLKFFQRSRAAGWFMLPYLAWVTFAAFLNYTIWSMNR